VLQSSATPRSLRLRGPRQTPCAGRTPTRAPLPALLICNNLPSYTSHTQAVGSATGAAPRTAATHLTSATGTHSLAAATLPTTAHSMQSDAAAIPKVRKSAKRNWIVVMCGAGILERG
jgi:hypothetical protein